MDTAETYGAQVISTGAVTTPVSGQTQTTNQTKKPVHWMVRKKNSIMEW
jgi:ethanolamine utilization protein EutA (predicted chaperonin)